MLIGIDGSRAFVPGRTGTENYSYQLLKHLSQIDTQNRYLIYLRNGNSLGLDGWEAGMEKGLGVKGGKGNLKDWPRNFEFKVIGLPRLWTQIGLAFRTFVDPLDVLFVPSHTLPLFRRPGLKTVVTVHDLGAEYLPALHQLKQLLYLNFMTHHQIKTATKVISVSEATKKDLVKRVGIKPSKVEVVYEGVDETVFRKLPIDMVNDIVKKYDLVRGKYFLFVGTIQPRKNLERLIRAFNDFQKNNAPSFQEPEILGNRRFRMSEGQNVRYSGKSDSLKFRSLSHSEFSEGEKPSFKLVLVGGKGWKSDSIYKLPKELGIEDRVRFLGRIEDEDLVGLYNGATALTYPSLFEGFGLPIVEAFACGCPVITSNTSSMPEVAGDAAILVNPNETTEISKAMRSMVDKDALRSLMINKGILRYKKFDWKVTAERTIEILERTVGK